MVELDEWAVAQGIRCQVVIVNFVRLETTSERTCSLVPGGRQPLPIGFHSFAGVNGGKRRRNPSRLEGVGGVCSSADFFKAKLPASINNGPANLLTFLVRSPDLQSRSPGHTVAQRADFAAGDVDYTHVEKPHIGNRPAVQLFQSLWRIRTLNLVTVTGAKNR